MLCRCVLYVSCRVSCVCVCLVFCVVFYVVRVPCSACHVQHVVCFVLCTVGCLRHCVVCRVFFTKFDVLRVMGRVFCVM